LLINTILPELHLVGLLYIIRTARSRTSYTTVPSTNLNKYLHKYTTVTEVNVNTSVNNGSEKL